MNKTVNKLTLLFLFFYYILLPAAASGGVAVTQNLDPGATSWPGGAFLVTASNPASQLTISESFSTNSVISQTFTVPESGSYRLESICIYAGGGTGSGTATPVRLFLFDLGSQTAPDPASYSTSTSLLGGGGYLAVNYVPQANGVLRFDFTESDQVLLEAGHMYAFELTGYFETNPIGWFRANADIYSDGAAYRGRSWLNGSSARDFGMAVYGTQVGGGSDPVIWEGEGITVTQGFAPAAISWPEGALISTVGYPSIDLVVVDRRKFTPRPLQCPFRIILPWNQFVFMWGEDLERANHLP